VCGDHLSDRFKGMVKMNCSNCVINIVPCKHGDSVSVPSLLRDGTPLDEDRQLI
jgi:hypothetical protein